jgi:hypothetical protein
MQKIHELAEGAPDGRGPFPIGTYGAMVNPGLGISMERRIRKKKRMDGDGSTDAAIIFDAELRREMLSVIDMLTGEIYSRFQQVYNLANKYVVLAPSNLLDDNYDCQLGEVDDEVEKRNSWSKGED